MSTKITFLVFTLLIMAGFASAEEPVSDSTQPVVMSIPTLVDTAIIIPQLDLSGVPLADALRALARAYNLSIFIDSTVTGSIAIRLDSVSLNDALLFIIDEYKLDWEKTGEIVKIFRPLAPTPIPEPLNINYSAGLLSLDLTDAKIERLIDTLIDITGRNIILQVSARGRVTSKLADLELEQALKIALPANGFSVKTIDGIIYVDAETSVGGQRQNLIVDCDQGLVSLDASQVPLSNVLTILASECGINLLLNSPVEGAITASFDNKTVSEALTYILLNSNYTFKEVDKVYFIGTKESEDLHTTRLVRLKHLIANNVIELIPVTISKQLTIKLAKEHNGLVLTGPRTSIARLISFINEVDVPVAQVLFEILLVDYQTTDRAEFGLTANNYGGAEGLPGQTYYPDINLADTGPGLNRKLRSMEDRLDIGSLGTLGDDFFVKLKAMAQEGTANIKSYPRLASLNGHPAVMEIGVTQYYLLENATTYPSQGNATTATAQRFETIAADMRIEVTPYVNSGGELIVEVLPEFNTPAQAFDPDIPPTINHRMIKSTVRLKDGETIVLGGLVQETDTKTVDKVPILGSIPFIGRLFQNHRTEKIKSELMIYITPHVYYGSEQSIDLDSILGESIVK